MKDCVVGVRRKRRRRVIVAGAAAMLAGGAAIAFAKFREEARDHHVMGQMPVEYGEHVQGGISAPPESAPVEVKGEPVQMLGELR